MIAGQESGMKLKNWDWGQVLIFRKKNEKISHRYWKAQKIENLNVGGGGQGKKSKILGASANAPS